MVCWYKFCGGWGTAMPPVWCGNNGCEGGARERLLNVCSSPAEAGCDGRPNGLLVKYGFLFCKVPVDCDESG